MSRELMGLIGAAALWAAAGTYAHAASPDDTRIADSLAAITDATGAKWTLNGGYVYLNGQRDTTSYGVLTLAYEAGRVWQMNTAHRWWYRSSGGKDAWAPSQGTLNSPLPPLTASITSGGLLTIHTDPFTMVGVFAYSADCYHCNYAGSATLMTGGLGNIAIGYGSLGFNSADYWQITELNHTLLSQNGGTYMTVSTQIYFGSQDTESAISENYPVYAHIGAWEAMVYYAQNQPARWAKFADDYLPVPPAGVYSYPTYVYCTLNGTVTPDGGSSQYVITNRRTDTTIASINNRVFLGTDSTQGTAKALVEGGMGNSSGGAHDAFATGAVRIKAPY